MGTKHYITNVKTNGNFTNISNDILDNKDMTYHSKYVLISILKLPPNFKINKGSFHRNIGMGRKAFVAGFNLLVELGYIKEVKYKGSNNLYVYEYYISSEPQYLTVLHPGVNPHGLTEQGLPASANRSGLTEKGKHNNTVKQHLSNNTIKENYINKIIKEDINLSTISNIDNNNFIINKLVTVQDVEQWLLDNNLSFGTNSIPYFVKDTYYKELSIERKEKYLLNICNTVKLNLEISN